MAGSVITLVRPTADGSTLQWQLSTGATHYTLIDDVVTQPTSSGTTDFIFAGLTNDDDIDEIILSTTSIPKAVWRIDQVIVWYLINDAGGDGLTFRSNVKIAGSWQTEKTFIPAGSGTFAWDSLTWTGSWTRDNFADFQVRCQAEASMTTSDEFQIAVLYANIYGYSINQQMV